MEKLIRSTRATLARTSQLFYASFQDWFAPALSEKIMRLFLFSHANFVVALIVIFASAFRLRRVIASQTVKLHMKTTFTACPND
jgi:hypothetical protein